MRHTLRDSFQVNNKIIPKNVMGSMSTNEKVSFVTTTHGKSSDFHTSRQQVFVFSKWENPDVPTSEQVFFSSPFTKLQADITIMEDEKENLCEQLALQERAVKDLEQEILECQTAQKEHLEVIVQLQQKGCFLSNKNAQHPDLLKLEIRALEHKINACLEDLKILTKLPKNVIEHPGDKSVDNSDEVLIIGMARLAIDIAQVEAENEALKQDIIAMKAQ